MAPLSRNLAEYTLEMSITDLPEEVVEQASLLTLDTVGCTVGGFTSQPSKSLRRAFVNRDAGRESATIHGTDRRIAVEYAALINATMGRYLDFNDCYSTERSVCHPSDHIPALVSVAESEGATGAELIEAIVLAYEIQCRGVDTGALWDGGFDYTTWGAHAAAAAAGKLMGLSADQLVDAIGIAATANNGLLVSRLGELSNWKAVAQPYATHNAIQACQLARCGVTGPEQVFEGPGGFFEAVSGGEVSFDGLDGSEGGYRILETSFKAFSCGYFTHPALTAVLDIVEEHELSPSEIDSIDVRTFDHAVQVYASGPEKWRTDLNRETADHSLPYNVAIAVFEREVTPRQYREDHLRDEKVHDLMQRITVEEDDALTTHRQDNPRHIPASVSIATTRGVYETRVDYPRGHPERPLTKVELETKMRALSRAHLTEEQIDRVVRFCDDLQAADSVRHLVEALVI